MFHLRVMSCLMIVCLHLCRSEELLPQDAVTLMNLRVDDQGMARVEIVIKDIYDTLSKTDLKVVLTDQDSSGDVIVTQLENATRLSGNFVSSTIQGLMQDIRYSVHLRANESIISHNYTLVTTGLQSIVNIHSSEIMCEFLPDSRADGCFVEWRPMNLIGGEAGYTILTRDQNKASARLQSLIPGTFYQVCGFGLRDGDRLHAFPIALQEGLIVQPTGTTVTGASGTMTESRQPIDTMILVTTLSAVLGVIMVTTFVLICIIIGIVKGLKKSMPEDAEQKLSGDEDIQTSTNICYGESVPQISETLSQSKKKRDSLHLYDDIVAVTLPTNMYENVDTETGLPTIPKLVASSENSLDKPLTCERACLPLKGITPLLSSCSLHKPQKNIKKSQSSLGRVCTFNHKQLRSPQKFATLSVVLEAADYETPTEHIRVTAL